MCTIFTGRISSNSISCSARAPDSMIRLANGSWAHVKQKHHALQKRLLASVVMQQCGMCFGGEGGGGALLAEKVLVVSHQQFHCYDKTEGAGRQRGREGVKNLGGRLGVEQANQLGHQRAANSCTGPHGAPDGDGFTGGALARSCGALVL